LGQKPFREAENSNNGVMNPKLFNLYFGKLLDKKALGNVNPEDTLLFLKKIFFFGPLVKYIEILLYSNKAVLFERFLK
jgi:hypothetical protein